MSNDRVMEAAIRLTGICIAIHAVVQAPRSVSTAISMLRVPPGAMGGMTGAALSLASFAIIVCLGLVAALKPSVFARTSGSGEHGTRCEQVAVLFEIGLMVYAAVLLAQGFSYLAGLGLQHAMTRGESNPLQYLPQIVGPDAHDAWSRAATAVLSVVASAAMVARGRLALRAIASRDSRN